MNFDENGYARYENGDVAIVDGSKRTGCHWEEDFDRLADKQVHIVAEFEDSEGYYYSVVESGYAFDITLLRPANGFELDDDEDISDADISNFFNSYAVGV